MTLNRSHRSFRLMSTVPYYCILRADLSYSPPSMVLMMMWTSSALSSISGISLACPSMSHPVQISGMCACVCSLVSVRVCSGHRSTKHLRKSISYLVLKHNHRSVRKRPVKFSNMLIIPFLEKMPCFVEELASKTTEFVEGTRWKSEPAPEAIWRQYLYFCEQYCVSICGETGS